MTKIAFGAASVDSLRQWLESQPGQARTSTRYLPRRHEEMASGSLYWIFDHALVGRSPLLGFSQRDDGRWWIALKPRLIAVRPIPKRAHQGWRYLTDKDAPPDLAPGEEPGEALPALLSLRLRKLGLL